MRERKGKSQSRISHKLLRLAAESRRPLWVALLVATLMACEAPAQQLAQPLASYQGEKVATVELAGQPGINREALDHLIAQPAGQPFSAEKVESTIAALKTTGQFRDVQLQVLPEPSGLHVMFVLQPALYIGLLEFPGGTEKFPYTRLLQVANYPNQEPYSESRVRQAQSALLTFLRRNGYFLATVRSQIQPDYQHGVVNVIFPMTLERQARFGAVNITGTSEALARELDDKLHSLGARIKGAYISGGKRYSLKKLQTATAYLQNHLRSHGYVTRRVQLLSANYDPESNRADVTFQVTPGPLVEVKTEGAKIKDKVLRKRVPIYQEGAVDSGLVEEGARNLVSYLQTEGYYDPRVHWRIEDSPKKNTIIYQIEKGERHSVAEVSVRGNQHLSEEELLSHVPVEEGRFFSHGKYSEQLLRDAVKNLTAVYQNAGFSEVTVTPVARRTPDLHVTFQIAEGPRDRVKALHIEGNESLSQEQLAPKGLKLRPGMPYSPQLLKEDRDQIIATYLDHGYLVATFRSEVQPEPEDPHAFHVTYVIEEGPQVHAERVITLGEHQTRPDLVRLTASIKPGRPVPQSQLLAAEGRLYSLGVFDWAAVGLRRPISDQRQADVVIKLHESKRNTITYGGGFEAIKRGGNVPGGTVALPGLPPVGLPEKFQTSEKTFYGPRGSFEFTRRNLRGMAETLTLGVLVARLDQRVAANYHQPAFLGSSWSSSTTLSGERTSENPIYTARLGDAGFQLQKYLDANKTKTVYLRYNFKKTVLVNLLIPDLVAPEDRNVRLSTFSASFSRDTRDSPLDAHHGIYESAEIGITPSALGSSSDFIRFLGQTAYYRPLTEDMVWANSVRLGLAQPIAGGRVPVSERFFSGGGSSLRGFPLNGAGPQRDVAVCSDPADPSTCSQIRVPLGGNELFILNSELRFPIPMIDLGPIPLKDKLGGVVFYDGGNVYERVGFHRFIDDYTNTVGFGLRYQTPVGPVRIDIGHNLNAVPGIGATQVFITLGQAF